MPRNCYTCAHRTGEYACALNIKDYPCVNFSRWESMIKAFTSSLTKDITLKEACMAARKDRDRLDKSLKEEVLKEAEEMGQKFLCCGNCKHKGGSVWKEECRECELWPHRVFKNNWEADTPELPEKHEGLNILEAQEAYDAGWELVSEPTTDTHPLNFFWTKTERAGCVQYTHGTFKVVGRRKGE